MKATKQEVKRFRRRCAKVPRVCIICGTSQVLHGELIEWFDAPRHPERQSYIFAVCQGCMRWGIPKLTEQLNAAHRQRWEAQHAASQ